MQNQKGIRQCYKRDRISALGIRSFLRIPGFEAAVWAVFWQSGAVNNRKQLKCGRKTYKMGCKLKSIKSRIRSFGTIMRKRIVIIGGGASGLTAAIGGARNGAHVTIGPGGKENPVHGQRQVQPDQSADGGGLLPLRPEGVSHGSYPGLWGG